MKTFREVVTNRWMNSPRFLSISAHTWFGCSLVETVSFVWGPQYGYPTVLILAVVSALKEFWFDANYELPAQTGRDNWEGFISYVAGSLLGLLIVGHSGG